MKKILASAIVAALFFTAQVFGQDYQTKGSGESSKKMNSKTTTTAKPTTTGETKTVSTNTQSEVSPAVKPPDGQKQDTKTSTQGTGQKSGTAPGTTKTGTGATTVKSGSGNTQTGGTMTSANASMQSGKIYDAQGNLFATVDKEGWIRNPNNRLMGQYTSSGEYYTKNRVKAGSVQNGTIRDMNGKDYGKIGQDGRVYDAGGKLLGTIASDGTITDAQGKKIGSAQGVDKNVAAMIFFYQASGSSVKSGKR